MMPAEEWYEYQGNYKKYGLSMRPEKAEPLVKKQKNKSNVTSRDKVAMMFLTIFVGVIAASLIITTAYSAKVKYEINQVIAENDVMIGEIENLTVKINQANNIQSIEEKAVNELGMVYPNPEEFIYIQGSAEPVQDFALLLKEEAYN